MNNKSHCVLVSVLIPLYNHSKYIIECLDSIIYLDSNDLNIELIICDDGSTDDSCEKVNDWILKNKSNPRLKVIFIKQNNSGVCSSLNKLLSLTTGDYILICASDDVLLPNSIKQRLTIFQENDNIDAVIGDALLIDSDSNVISASAMKTLYNADFSIMNDFNYSEQILNWSIVGPTLMIKKYVYDKIGFYDESLKVEDRDFYLKLFSSGLTVHFLDCPVARYRVHLDNSSRKNINSRAIVWSNVSESNVRYAAKFSGLIKLFLVSHNIDLYILNKLNGKYRVFLYCFNVFRVARTKIFYYLFKLFVKINLIKNVVIAK